jgi:hypothetical protein
MTRTRWLVLGALATVAGTAVVLSERGPERIPADTGGGTIFQRSLTVTGPARIGAP